MPQTTFLNADLIITDCHDLCSFSQKLAQRGLMVLNVYPTEDGLWRATFECDSDSGDDRFNEIIENILQCIETLPAVLRYRWNALQHRSLDIGFKTGSKVDPYTRHISAEFLRRMDTIHLALGITIYSHTQASLTS
ncbi:hypothetical protein ACVBEF_11555 [Glaciimonas sp. GG7]